LSGNVRNRATRALGALAAVLLVMALVVRFVLHDAPVPLVVTDGGEPRKRYVSSLDRSIRGLSSGADVALAVGDDGLIVRHHAGGGWDADVSPTKKTLRAVAQQLDEAIAVGDDGTIAERDGATWKLVPSVTSHTLRTVVYTSWGAVAAGDAGTIVRRSAPQEPWQLEPSGTTRDLFGACAGLRDVWIVGAEGTILFRKALEWSIYPPVTPKTIMAVTCDDHAAIAVGAQGLVLERLDDVGWYEAPNIGGVTSDLLAVSSSVGTRSWLVAGAHGTLIRMSGNASIEPTGLDWDLRAVTEGALGTWIGGERGIVRP
jgi:hypothetical protein